MQPHTQTLFDSQPGDSISRSQDEQHVKSGANWFYAIAGLSLVTSVVSLAGGHWAFFVSLNITQFFDAVATSLAERWGGSVKIIALLFDLLAAGVFALAGYFATKRHAWAFIAGVALYVLDALVFFGLILLLGGPALKGLLVLAFHAYVLWKIFGGYKACARLAATGGNVPPPPPPPVATPV